MPFGRPEVGDEQDLLAGFWEYRTCEFQPGCCGEVGMPSEVAPKAHV